MYQTTNLDASNFVKGVDTAFMLILGSAFILLISITLVMIYFILRYRKEKNPQASQIHGNNTLEILWTVIPTVLVLVMFYFGWAGWRPMKNAPKDAMHIKTVARMWKFNFEYENGRRTDTLYVPKDKPVVLDLVSLDVIHGLYIPAFRVKEDIVPGREKTMWFQSGKPGKYDIFCTVFCGFQHSYMYTSVVVMPAAEFDKWYTDTTQLKLPAADAARPGARGLQILQLNGCNACHSVDGSKLVGPSYKGLWGSTVDVVTNGQERQVTVDEQYITTSVYDPNADLAKGYTKGLMLSYKDLLSGQDVADIIEYLKTLAPAK